MHTNSLKVGAKIRRKRVKIPHYHVRNKPHRNSMICPSVSANNAITVTNMSSCRGGIRKMPIGDDDRAGHVIFSRMLIWISQEIFDQSYSMDSLAMPYTQAEWPFMIQAVSSTLRFLPVAHTIASRKTPIAAEQAGLSSGGRQ